MADAKDAKDAKAGGGGAAPARRATDAQKAARARREKSIEVPVRDGDGEYVTIKANDPNVEVRWAQTALGMCSRWPGWKKAKTERAPKPTSLPGVPRDSSAFRRFCPTSPVGSVGMRWCWRRQAMRVY